MENFEVIVILPKRIPADAAGIRVKMKVDSVNKKHKDLDFEFLDSSEVEKIVKGE